MSPPEHNGRVPTWDEREANERARAARLRALRGRDGHLPAHVVVDGQAWTLRPLPAPYALNDAGRYWLV